MSSLCKKLCLPLLTVLAFSCLFAAWPWPKAVLAESTESRLESFTEDDSFTLDGQSYTIQEYTASLKDCQQKLTGSSLFARNVTYSYDANIPHRSVEIRGDDPIVEIVPRELFTKEGQTLYIGREYGFFIDTTSHENTSPDSLYSTVLLFDLVNKTAFTDDNPSQLVFSVHYLFQMDYVYLPAGSSSLSSCIKIIEPEFGFAIPIEPKTTQNAVVPLMYGSLTGSLPGYVEQLRYCLQDISFVGNIKNEQALNPEDSDYDLNKDDGPFLIRTDYYLNGIKTFESSGVSLDVIGEILGSVLQYVAGFSKTYGNLLGVTGTSFEIFSIIGDNVGDTKLPTNNLENSYFQCKYTTAAEQKQRYGGLIRTASVVANSPEESDVDISYFMFNRDDHYAEARFTVGNDSGHPDGAPGRIYREVGVKIRDQDEDRVIAASTSEKYGFGFYEERAIELTTGQSSPLAMLPEGGVNRFSFTPLCSGLYELIPTGVDQSSLTCTVNGKEISFSDLQQWTAGTEYLIEIQTDSFWRQLGSLRVRPDTELNDLTLAAGASRMVTIAFPFARAFNLISSNPQVSLISYTWPDSSQLETVSVNGSQVGLIQTSEIYVVIQNKSAQPQTVSLSLGETPRLTSGDNAVQYTLAPIVYRFYAETAGYHAVKSLPPCSLDFFDSDLNHIEAAQISADANISTFPIEEENDAVYVRVWSSTPESGTLNIDTLDCQWIVNGTPYSSSSVTLKRGMTHTFQFSVNGELLDSGFQYANAILSGKDTSELAEITFSSDTKTLEMTLGPKYTLQDTGIVLSPVTDLPFEFNLTVKPDFENEIMLDFFNNSSGLGFKVDAQPELRSLTLRYTTGNRNKDKTYSLPEGHTGGFVSFDILEWVESWAPLAADISVQILRAEVLVQGEVVSYENPSAPHGVHSFNAHFEGGNGENGSPFLINCRRHFLNIQLLTYYNDDLGPNVVSGYFKLTGDFGMPDESWECPYLFNGHLDGDGHFITGLKINITKGGYYGLFGRVEGGSISNLRLQLVNITGEVPDKSLTLVGGICGIGGTITNCTVNGTIRVTARNGSVGGIVGLTYNSVTDCSNWAEVSATSAIDDDEIVTFNSGGIAGSNHSRISNCTNNDFVWCVDGAAGGIAGSNEGTITNCANGEQGSVYLQVTEVNNEWTRCGGIVGHNWSEGSVSGCVNRGYVGYLGNNLNDSRELQPALAEIVGRNQNGTVDSDNYSDGGTLATNSLKVVTWQILFWTYSFDQTLYCNTIVGREG